MKIVPTLLPGHHSKGRGGWKPDVIVIHVMEGSMAGTLEHFLRGTPEVSAHYGISLLGSIVQYVNDGDTAWANGRVLRPTAAIVKERPGINPNRYSYSIEFEGDGKRPLTPAQLHAAVPLIRKLSRQDGIPINRRHVIRHDEIFAEKSCPGRIDVDELVERAAGPAVPAEPPNLERIIVPGPEHFEEVIRVSSVFTRENVRPGIAAMEIVLRGAQRAGLKHAKLFADAASAWLKATE